MLLNIFANLTVIHRYKKSYVVIKLYSVYNNSIDFHSNIYIPQRSEIIILYTEL